MTQALRALEKVRTKVLSGEFELESQSNNPTIEKFAEKYLANRRYRLRAWKRDALSVRTLLMHFSGKQLSAITPSDIENYISKRRNEGVSNATINRELSCLKRMYTLAVKWGDAKKNPVTDVDFLEEPPGRTRFLTVEECQGLVECSQEHLRPIVLTALLTGMRLGELLNLKWAHVHIDHVIDPYIEIEISKNNKKRFVPLNSEMVELLSALRAKARGPEHVFLSIRGKPLQSVEKPFLRALKEANISDFRWHDLRHTFASHFVMNGGDLLALKEILGHSSLQMVQRYAHLSAAHKREQINNLSGKFTKICHKYASSGKSVVESQKRKAL
jgi:site-specific recombinase XerD